MSGLYGKKAAQCVCRKRYQGRRAAARADNSALKSGDYPRDAVRDIRRNEPAVFVHARRRAAPRVRKCRGGLP